MRRITKRFPRVLANDAVDFSVLSGETHALVGENGAGKSTLMRILYGLYQPDRGEILIRGERMERLNPHRAIARGVGMVHQHFMLIPPLTVAENIVLGREFTRDWVFLDLKKAADRVAALADRFNLKIDPLARIWSLSVGQQQRVEILKILFRGAEILILDEPTAVLTPAETDELFSTLNSLKKEGKTVIFITHKLREVIEFSDRVSVMRKGKMVGVKETGGTTPPEIARMMVGREVILAVAKPPARPGKVMLSVENLCARDRRGLPAVKNFSLTVRAGEILGIAGVEGNGQTELLEAIAGLRPVDSGRIAIAGREVSRLSPRGRFRAGLAHIPEDRLERGLILDYSIADNLILGKHDRPPFASFLKRDFARIDSNAREQIGNFDIRPPAAAAPARNLSGGNQQKIILARELSRRATVLIAAQPTRGVDIGAIEFIHSRIIAAREQGLAVLLVSAELSEVMSLSDRILVIYEGEIAGEMNAAKATEAEIGEMMTGAGGNKKSEVRSEK
ncbi:MAG: ABC transporter ATP-binding protein [Candidatus Aureabacteria bacterium]|nr:ABC transporter ATP-binding protein [Candidatus Auribacterota bacterium]